MNQPISAAVAVYLPADLVAKMEEPNSVVNLDSIDTIPKNLLVNRICKKSPTKMDEVKEAVFEAFDMK